MGIEKRGIERWLIVGKPTCTASTTVRTGEREACSSGREARNGDETGPCLRASRSVSRRCRDVRGRPVPPAGGCGHRVDLFANAWDSRVDRAGVSCHEVKVSGRLRTSRILSFARNAEAALAGHRFDCTIGLINTWSQDMLIPQGGVHPASLDYNARRFPEGWKRSMYRAGKRLNPRFQRLSVDRERGNTTIAGGRYVAVSRMVQQHLEHYYSVPSDRITVIPNAIDDEPTGL